MEYLGHTYIKTFIIYLQFKFNGPSYIGPPPHFGKPVPWPLLSVQKIAFSSSAPYG